MTNSIIRPFLVWGIPFIFCICSCDQSIGRPKLKQGLNKTLTLEGEVLDSFYCDDFGVPYGPFFPPNKEDDSISTTAYVYRYGILYQQKYFYSKDGFIEEVEVCMVVNSQKHGVKYFFDKYGDLKFAVRIENNRTFGDTLKVTKNDSIVEKGSFQRKINIEELEALTKSAI